MKIIAILAAALALQGETSGEMTTEETFETPYQRKNRCYTDADCPSGLYCKKPDFGRHGRCEPSRHP